MTLRNLIKNIMMMIIMIELGMCVAAAKAVKTDNPSHMQLQRRRKSQPSQRNLKSLISDIEYTMDSAPGLA